MKKVILAVALMTAFITTQAQVTVQGSKFSDNWSIGLNGVGVSPLTHHAFWKNMRGGVSLDLNKQVTPVLGFTLEGSAYFNASEGAFANPIHTSTIIDATNISLLGRLNLMNMFAGYKGTPRAFEMEVVAGAGWLHTYGKLAHTNFSSISNTFSSKVGLNFNFNLGETKAWTVSVKPAIVWNMSDPNLTDNASQVRYNGNNASVELAAGITYHFKNSNGTRSFKIADLKNQSEIDALNSQVNSLRAQLSQKESDLNACNNSNNQLQSELDACRAKKPVVQTVDNSKNSMESVVTFAQGKSVIATSQLPNVERIATYMKNHKNANVVIKGYASPEGSAEINAKIANARAEAVKTLLVKKYKINAKRISAQGEGVGNMFSEPDWNRVSIATLEEGK